MPDKHTDPRWRLFRYQKHNAHKRNIAWNLQFWEWLQIWEDSGHFADRGPHKGQWVMSRTGDAGPYEAGNVKIVLVETNLDEGARTRSRKPRVRLITKTPPNHTSDDLTHPAPLPRTLAAITEQVDHG